MAYQDLWIRGTVQQAGDRACAGRYAAITSVIDQYRRRVTVWDLGANRGYFGCRLAAEYDAVSVMVDPRRDLVDACRQNALPGTIAMSARLTARDVTELAKSEHADVVLALNVLHHCEDWPQMLSAVLALGEQIVIETPGRGDVGSAHYARSQALLDELESLKPAVMGWSDSHVTPGVKRPIYLFHEPKPTVTAGYAYGGRVRARGAHPARVNGVASTWTDKRIVYADGECREWFHGMNLWNWLQMGGSYPDKATVKQAVRDAFGEMRQAHGDFAPWNLVLQGDRVAVIDAGHRRSREDAQGLVDTLRAIDAPESAYVQ